MPLHSKRVSVSELEEHLHLLTHRDEVPFNNIKVIPTFIVAETVTVFGITEYLVIYDDGED